MLRFRDKGELGRYKNGIPPSGVISEIIGSSEISHRRGVSLSLWDQDRPGLWDGCSGPWNMRYLLNPCFLPLLVVLALTGSRGGQAAPQALGSQNSSQPMNTTSQRTQDGAGRRLASGHLSEADVRWRTDPRGEGRFAPVRRPAIESGRATLTKMDLAELPVDNNTYHIPRPSKYVGSVTVM